MQYNKKLLTAREVAFLVLGEYRRNDAWVGIALGNMIEKHGIPPREAALSTQIVCGVLQNMRLCDFYVAHFSATGLRKIEPRVLDILRLSIYQIVFLTKVPHRAAVNEGVALTKKHFRFNSFAFRSRMTAFSAEPGKSVLLPTSMYGRARRSAP